jgi:hypothetical protein
MGRGSSVKSGKDGGVQEFKGLRGCKPISTIGGISFREETIS